MTTLDCVLAAAFTSLLAGLSVLQVLLSVGLPLGRFAWGGQQDQLPPRLRVAAALAVLIYVLFAVIALARLQVVTAPVPESIVGIAMWVITAYLFVSVLPNLASKSRKERCLMTPVSIALAALSLLIALN